MVAASNAGVMPFRDEGADEALAACLADGTFRCTTDRSVISACEVVVTVIGTPIGGHLNPETDAVQRSIPCNYPSSSVACGSAMCSGATYTPAGSCNAAGSCSAGSPINCSAAPPNTLCNAAGG
ncbi:MAG TPA: hypothetical protein VF331_04750 [Polyangiales bacterium]